MRYEIPFVYFGDTAKNHGIIPERAPTRGVTWVVLDAGTPDTPDDAAAYKAIVKLFPDRRNRPIAGRSYVRKWRAPDVALNDGHAPLNYLPVFKMGDRVLLHRPHAAGASHDGKGFRRGAVFALLGGTQYAIKLDGYANIASFTLREFVSEPA